MRMIGLLMLCLGCPAYDRQTQTAVPDASPRHSAPAVEVVRGSRQPRCNRDADCPNHSLCVCGEEGCSVRYYTSEDLGEPASHFCVPAPDEPLPPELRDAGK